MKKSSVETPISEVHFQKEDGTFVVLLREVVAFLNPKKASKDRSKSGEEGKESPPHRGWSKKSRRNNNRNTQ